MSQPSVGGSYVDVSLIAPEIDKLRGILDELKNENESLSAENTDLRAALNDALLALDQDKSTVVTDKRLESAIRRADTLGEENFRLVTELSRLDQAARETTSQSEQLSGLVLQLRRQLEEKNNEIEQMRQAEGHIDPDNLKTTESERDTAIQCAQRLQAQLDQALLAIKTLTADRERALRAAETARDDAAQAQERARSSTERAYETADNEITELKRQLADMSAQAEDARRAAREADDRLSQQAAQFGSISSESRHRLELVGAALGVTCVGDEANFFAQTLAAAGRTQSNTRLREQLSDAKEQLRLAEVRAADYESQISRLRRELEDAHQSLNRERERATRDAEASRLRETELTSQIRVLQAERAAQPLIASQAVNGALPPHPRGVEYNEDDRRRAALHSMQEFDQRFRGSSYNPYDTTRMTATDMRVSQLRSEISALLGE